MKMIDINVHTSDWTGPRLIKIAEDATVEELMSVIKAAGAVIGELEADIAFLVENEEKLLKRGHKLSDCGIKHGHHVHYHRNGHHHKHHEHHHKLILTIVVNGTPTDVEANPEAPLSSVIPIALKQTGNEGQPPSNWELKDVKGVALDVNKKIEGFHFPCDVKLFLSLKAGVGGNHGRAS